ncbi:MAG: hypothetical protein O0X93_09850 [Methanocorpusculum sp.]|nr:hypothetical protein [Methanocorpusculum sp.]MDE2523437.1 hypothetical protein [Methanocorpusculum sp.]MDE2523569.1 hypothetical protein [Methanocorpusculum sp.]
MKSLLPLILLLAVLATAGCIQPPAPLTENETGFNLSAVERDPVREAGAFAAEFPPDADELRKTLPPFPQYYAFMNNSENKTYFDYLVYTHPAAYAQYRNFSLNMSFIAFLERYDTGYPYTLNHDQTYVPYRLGLVYNEYRDHNNTVITLTEEGIRENPILSSYFIEAPGYPIKVLREEECLLDPFRYAYLEWNGTLYQQIRSIA